MFPTSIMPAYSSIDNNDGHHEVAAADRDITTFIINQTHDQELSELTHQSPFINPWPAEPQHEDGFPLVVPWRKALPIRTQLSTAKADLTFEVSSKPTGTKGTSLLRTAIPPSNPTTPEKRGWSHPDFVGGSSQESPNMKEEKRIKMTQNNNVPEFSRSIKNPMECFPASNLDSNYVSFVPTSENMENRTQEDYLSTSVAPVGGGVPELAQQRRNLYGDSQIHIDHGNLDLDWNPSPIRFGESVHFMEVPTNAHYPTQLGSTDPTKAANTEALVDHHDRGSGTDDDAEPECGFNLKAIKKTAKDLMKEMQREEKNPASKNRQVSPTTAMMCFHAFLLTYSPPIGRSKDNHHESVT